MTAHIPPIDSKYYYFSLYSTDNLSSYYLFLFISSKNVRLWSCLHSTPRFTKMYSC